MGGTCGRAIPWGKSAASLLTKTGGRLPIGLEGKEGGRGKVWLSARAIGGGVGAGTAGPVGVAILIVLGWVGVNLGVVSGSGQGGAKAFNPELVLALRDPEMADDLCLGGMMVEGRLQSLSLSAGEQAVMVASLEIEEDRDRCWDGDWN